MENTPIWRILQQMDAAETADLEDFSGLSYFGATPEMHQLLLFLQKNKSKQRCPTRAACYQVLYPDRIFKAEQFRQILHKLTEIVRTYLVYKALEEDALLKDRLLALQLEKLDLNLLAQQTLQKAEKRLEQSTQRGPGWHEARFQLRRQIYSNELAGARTQQLNLQDFSDDLEFDFMLRKLKLSCELISHSAVYRSNYDFGLLDAVLEKIRTSEKLRNTPEIAVYYHCCLALLNPDEAAHFETLKPYLHNISAFFQPQESRDVLLLSINYCIRKLNQGSLQYSHEGLNLYQLALEKGFLYKKGEISRFTFRNIVGMGLKIGAFDWVESFITSHQDKLPAPHRESMVSFNFARLCYERKQYDQALHFLQKADYQDILLALAAKTLLLKIYYETQAFRSLDAAIDSFKIFLRRKKVLAYHRNNYQNFLKYMERLLALHPSNLSEKNILQASILNEETLTEKAWFLSKLV
jgi:hypothetical protein